MKRFLVLIAAGLMLSVCAHYKNQSKNPYENRLFIEQRVLPLRGHSRERVLPAFARAPTGADDDVVLPHLQVHLVRKRILVDHRLIQWKIQRVGQHLQEVRGCMRQRNLQS